MPGVPCYQLGDDIVTECLAGVVRGESIFLRPSIADPSGAEPCNRRFQWSRTSRSQRRHAPLRGVIMSRTGEWLLFGLALLLLVTSKYQSLLIFNVPEHLRDKQGRSYPALRQSKRFLCAPVGRMLAAAYALLAAKLAPFWLVDSSLPALFRSAASATIRASSYFILINPNFVF